MRKKWSFFRTDVRYSMTPFSRVLLATSAKLVDAIAFSIAVWFHLIFCSGPPGGSRQVPCQSEEASNLSELIGLSQMRDAKEAQGSLGRYGIATLIMAWVQQADDDIAIDPTQFFIYIR